MYVIISHDLGRNLFDTKHHVLFRREGDRWSPLVKDAKRYANHKIAWDVALSTAPAEQEQVAIVVREEQIPPWY